jgi:NAD+ diphosphatase
MAWIFMTMSNRNSSKFNRGSIDKVESMQEIYQYCPVCQSAMISKIVDHCDRLVCSSPKCEFIFWNSPVPVVAGIIETDKGIVLAKNNAWTGDVYSLIAGFINPNESPIDAMKRECKEELNLTALAIDLVGIYPFEQRNQIILVYHVQAEGDIFINDELHSFKTFSRQELRSWPFGQDKLDGWPFGCGWAIKDLLKK